MVKGSKHTKETRQKMSMSRIGKVFTEETKEKLHLNHKGCLGKHWTLSKETRDKMRKRQLGKSSPNKGKRFSKTHRKNMRISALKYIENQVGHIRCGTNEKQLLDEQEKKDNVKIARQVGVPGLGYVVDGYCPETNTVYEVYERYHNRQVQKDLERETEICNRLSCNFVIIWDNL